MGNNSGAERWPCPLCNETIDSFVCMETQDYVNEIIKPDTLPNKFKPDNWREICKACPRHDFY